MTFSELRSIVDHASEGLTFMGYRYLRVDGYNGTVSIDALAARVMELVNKCNFNFSFMERRHGRAIAHKITRMYRSNDKRVQSQNFLIKFMDDLRNIPYRLYDMYAKEGRYCSATRWYWMEAVGESQYCNVFNFYTRNQYYYLWHFGRTPSQYSRFIHPEPNFERVNVYHYNFWFF